MKRLPILLTCLAFAASVSACTPASSPDIMASADSAVPADTLTDWATYSDALAVFTVKSEEKLPRRENEVERGEGTIGRVIEISIDKPVWTRPSLRKGLTVPTDLTTGGGFWTFHGDREQRVRVDNREWMEVGGQYLGVMAYIDAEFSANPQKKASDADPEWGPLVWMPVTDGRLGSVPGELDKQLVGLSPDEVGSLLDRTKPDPAAIPFMSEDPALRYQHAMEGK